MNRRGFLFGLGATIAVIPAANLMRVAAPKLITPTYTWRRHAVSVLISNPMPESWVEKMIRPPIARKIMLDSMTFGMSAFEINAVGVPRYVDPLSIRA